MQERGAAAERTGDRVQAWVWHTDCCLPVSVNYGFVIDNTRCIGCHACSTACKSENEVPLGVNRTWVKTVEHGAYPDVVRTFQVTRCNHCANPPCVRICPVTAMYQRDDGIVEFDKDACIGCKACMQACPYDAIHIDPDTGTAAKCHYCAHRVDAGLEPACAVVCPTEAIVAGDLDDPMSKIAKTVARNRVTVRKPEQGTAPKVLYIDGDGVALHPTVLSQRPEQMMWADTVTAQGMSPLSRSHADGDGDPSLISGAARAPSGASIRVPGEQGMAPAHATHKHGAAGAGRGPGTLAEQMVQVAYNAQHEIPWHWPVPAYLVTKAIAAGIFLVMGLGWNLGLFDYDPHAMVFGGILSVLMTLATTGLLILDLERPERFLSILLRPQWKSWLTRGAFLLIAFSLVSTTWVGLSLLEWKEVLTISEGGRTILGWVTAPLALGTAIYTAFLFAQAEGRDLWQSPLLPAHFLIQSIIAGFGALLFIGGVLGVLVGNEAPGLHADFVTAMEVGLVAALVVDAFVISWGEHGIPHASEVAARAAHEIRHGKYARSFWWGAMGLGHALPVALLIAILAGSAVAGAAAAALGALAAVCAIVGLYAYEHSFVMAPQEVPNS